MWKWQLLEPAHIYTVIPTAAPVGPDRTTVLWALWNHNKPLSHWIPPHDFILGVGIMAFNQNTLLMTSVWIEAPLRYHMWRTDCFVCSLVFLWLTLSFRYRRMQKLKCASGCSRAELSGECDVHNQRKGCRSPFCECCLLSFYCLFDCCREISISSNKTLHQAHTHIIQKWLHVNKMKIFVTKQKSWQRGSVNMCICVT